MTTKSGWIDHSLPPPEPPPMTPSTDEVVVAAALQTLRDDEVPNLPDVADVDPASALEKGYCAKCKFPFTSLEWYVSTLATLAPRYHLLCWLQEHLSQENK